MSLANEEILREHIEDGFNDLESRKGRLRAFGVICKNEKTMAARYPVLADRIRSIKEYSLNNIDTLIDQAVKNFKANGCHVYFAETAEDANRYILSLVKPGSLVVKSKSNVSKEIGIVEALENHNCRVVETDLGDRIVQLAKSKPSHTMAPSIHIPREKVAEIFAKELGRPVEPVIEVLVRTAREALRNDLLTADVGISGANAIAAETGTVIVEENEGNIRAVTSLPRLHIVLAGINKIVPTLEDAIAVCRGAGVWGVGQDIGTYVSAISGPSKIFADGEVVAGGHGPQEVHIVLIDNGRHRAISEGFAEAFYCINCGSCLNYCPIYREIGDRYGYKYIGGIGVLQTAFMLGLDKAYQGGLPLCLSCRKCTEHCPNKIDTANLMAKLRDKLVKQEGLNRGDRLILHYGLKRANTTMGLARTFQGLALKKADDGEGGHPRFNFMGLETRRLVPMLAPSPLSAIVPSESKVSKPVARVAFFPGCFIDHIYTRIGKATVEVLTRNGVEVVLPQGRVCCGIPHYLKGDYRTARTLAEQNLELLMELDADAVVTACATCGGAFKDVYPIIYYTEPFSDKVFELSRKCYDIAEFLVQNVGLKAALGSLKQKVTYHDPCHLARWQQVTAEPRQLIQAIPGVKFEEMEEPDICCGASGTFCYHFYDFSTKINDRKIEFAQATEAQVLATGCPACIMQLRDGVHRHGLSTKVMHTVELLEMSLKEK